MGSRRREFLIAAAGSGPVALASGLVRGEQAGRVAVRKRNPIGVSTYSFWQFRGKRLGIGTCIDKAAEMGFDGVEILHVQMEDESTPALNKIKRQAHSLGLALMGFSTHQGFVSPDADLRRTNVQ